MTDTATLDFRTGHVGLNVSDLDRSRAFYQGVFGWTVQAEGTDRERRYVFLADQRGLVVTLWEQSEGRFATTSPGLHHLSFRLPDIESVEAAGERVRAFGGVIHHGGIVPHAEGLDSGGIYFEDLDGIRLEIFAPSGAASRSKAPAAGVPTCGFF